MANKKVDVIVKKVNDSVIYVFCDDRARIAKELENISGISSIHIWSDRLDVWVSDPRYDTDEVAQEIQELLTAEVPDVFREP